MGAWGNGPFDNDDAADFIAGIESSTSAEADLVAALDIENDADADEASTAIAAAAVVAITKTGETIEGVDDGTAGQIARVSLTPDAATALVPAALAALDAAAGDASELRELWAEVDETDAWAATLAPIRAALNS